MACFAQCGPEVKFLANKKKLNFLVRPEEHVNDILSLKTSGSGDENGFGQIYACASPQQTK